MSDLSPRRVSDLTETSDGSSPGAEVATATSAPGGNSCRTCCVLFLKALGGPCWPSFWLFLVSPGSSWPLLAPPGLSWLLLDPGYSWLLLDTPGSSWLLVAPLGSYWLFLAPPGFPWLLLARPRSPGYSWLLFDPPCLSWLLLASPGPSWALPGSSWLYCKLCALQLKTI
jgi:hypothetical protein